LILIVYLFAKNLIHKKKHDEIEHGRNYTEVCVLSLRGSPDPDIGTGQAILQLKNKLKTHEKSNRIICFLGFDGFCQ
jgi:hypothetical protein